MEKKKINILGHELGIAYNMATQIAYEEITGAAFDATALEKTSNMMALYYACILANNRDTTLTMDDLMLRADAGDIKALREAVLDSFAEWSKPVVGDQPLMAEDDKKKS